MTITVSAILGTDTDPDPTPDESIRIVGCNATVKLAAAVEGGGKSFSTQTFEMTLPIQEADALFGQLGDRIREWNANMDIVNGGD